MSGWKYRRGRADGVASDSRRTAAASQEHQDRVAREHTAELDHAVRRQVGVSVELDECVGAVAEPVDLARRCERGGADEVEVLVVELRLVRIDVGEVEYVALRGAVVGDNVRAGQAD